MVCITQACPPAGKQSYRGRESQRIDDVQGIHGGVCLGSGCRLAATVSLALTDVSFFVIGSLTSPDLLVAREHAASAEVYRGLSLRAAETVGSRVPQ